MLLSAILTLLPAAALAAPVFKAKREDVVPGKYIVKFKGEVNTLRNLGLSAKPDHEYSLPGFTGFASSLTPAEVKMLSRHADIDYIEEDAVVTTQATVTQDSVTWGLARVSHRTKGATSYVYDDSAGAGTCTYVIDTGVAVANPEFEGRATFLKDFTSAGDMKDGNGHGTHVAGTIGSKTYGIAKKTKIFAVRVLDSRGSGTNSGVIAGMNFVAQDAASRKADCPKGFSSNMSLGGGKTDAVNQAAAGIVKAGIFLAVAAGNSQKDANTFSPASEPTVCTVGATDVNDVLASFSNFGAVVDVLAPGVNVTSTWNDGNPKTISGTSMASPHVAGLGAYYLGLGKAVGTLCETITQAATKDAVTKVPKGTVNLLGFNSITA